jgi:hypothetical protein
VTTDTGDSQRLDRLEEGQMFAERRADLLSEQMTALEQKLRDVTDRLRRLEDSLGRLGAALENKPEPDADDLP